VGHAYCACHRPSMCMNGRVRCTGSASPIREGCCPNLLHGYCPCTAKAEGQGREVARIACHETGEACVLRMSQAVHVYERPGALHRVCKSNKRGVLPQFITRVLPAYGQGRRPRPGGGTYCVPRDRREVMPLGVC
jgi:hypothetical protein